MAFDFSPDLTPEDKIKPKKEKVEKNEVSQEVSKAEAMLAKTNIGNQDIITVNNLLGMTQSHIEDDNRCRATIEELTEELNNSIHLMSIKEILEYLKVKLREREFHVQCIFKAYDFIQKSEYAREAFIGRHRKERIIEASDRSRINGLLSILNN